MKKIIVAGIGPGGPEDMTPAVTEAIKEAEVIVGYKFYFQFIKPFIPPQCECIDTGMKKERERAELAFIQAEQGKTVVVISSGDAGIYGMTTNSTISPLAIRKPSGILPMLYANLVSSTPFISQAVMAMCSIAIRRASVMT